MVAAAIAAVFAGACDRGDRYVPPGAPPVHVVGTIPADNAVGVPLDQTIRVQFDRFLSPLAAVRQSACLDSVSGAVAEAGRGCDVFLEPTYDPVDRVAVFRPQAPLLPRVRYTMHVYAPGTDGANGIRAFDGAPLDADFTFSFTTGDASTPSHEPNRTVSYCFEPRTDLCAAGAEGSCGGQPSATRGPRTILGACTLCHRKTGGALLNGGSGAMLDLTDDGVRALVSPTVAIAGETRVGVAGGVVHRADDGTFAVDMPYLDSEFPGNSFLLYKLILSLGQPGSTRQTFAMPVYTCAGSQSSATTGSRGADSGDGGPDDRSDGAVSVGGDEAGAGEAGGGGEADASGADASDAGAGDAGACTLVPFASAGDPMPGPVEPWISPDQWKPPAPGEYDRLRAAILGNPMSPPGSFTTYYQDIETISAWIAAGLPDIGGPCSSP